MTNTPPPEAEARADCLLQLRRAASALVAWSLLSGRDHHVLGRSHAGLLDILDELEGLQ